MVSWKLYTFGGVLSAVVIAIAYHTPYWNQTCSAINRILVHNHVGNVLECGNNGDPKKKTNDPSAEYNLYQKIEEIIEKYSNDHIIRQLPRETLVTIIESHEFSTHDTVVLIADKILNYKGDETELSKAYHLRQDLSKLPDEYISVILKYEFHPNVADKVMNSQEIMVGEPTTMPTRTFELDRLDASLSTVVPSAKDYYDNLPDNSEMCDHAGAVLGAGISWVYCVCLKGVPKSQKNYVALRIKPTLTTEVREKEDTFICTVSFYTECLHHRGCYGYEPIKRVTPPQEINLGAITEENFALWKTLETHHMNTNGELSFGADVSCHKKPDVFVIKE